MASIKGLLSTDRKYRTPALICAGLSVAASLLQWFITRQQHYPEDSPLISVSVYEELVWANKGSMVITMVISAATVVLFFMKRYNLVIAITILMLLGYQLLAALQFGNMYEEFRKMIL